MKLKYTKVVEQKVEKAVPEWYSYDDSLRGRVADIFIKESFNRKTGADARSRLYSSDGQEVENAIRDIERAYNYADEIFTILGARYNR